jgi:hypothetical protein
VLLHYGLADGEVPRLLGEIRALGRGLNALVIGDGGRASDELAALRASAICYLRDDPLDRRKLADLLDLLTIRSRCRVR